MLDAGDVDGQKSLKGLSESVLLEKAKASIKGIIVEQLTAGKPESVEVMSAALQRQGGVLFTLDSREAKDWLVRPDVMTAFTHGFGLAVSYAPRKFPVLVEFVPVGLDISKKDNFADIETANGLQKGSIVGARWIRDPRKRNPAQRHAHLVVNCKTKEIANEWIANPKVLAGKEVESAKYIREPLRCHNCQLDGHMAARCLSPPVCGACGKDHQTHTCNDRMNFFCSSCKTEGHPTWSRSCLNFITRQLEHSDRVPDNKYRYYVTSEDWTWELLTNDSRRRSFRPPRERRAQAATGANATTLTRQPNATTNTSHSPPTGQPGTPGPWRKHCGPEATDHTRRLGRPLTII